MWSPLSSRVNGSPRSPAALRVIWAEDSDSDQYLIKAAVTGTPYESSIQFALDGEKALRELSKGRPTGIVLDVNLPNLDGITALKRIRERHGDVPVIMFSTANEPHQVQECRDMGILAYAVKPVDYEVFCVVVKGILAHLAGEAILDNPFIVSPASKHETD
ncbi:MAG TPA: response regulator [Candidatus Thermoplasmatota archaeon]|nr:response regulator [Candidatus Thermoplasmatota archaeon]